MYEVAARLDPDSYLALARAVYAEMALAGITCVGEFHYLHHGPEGVPYADPNEMGRALIDAAAQAGIRITLLDTCYLSGGLGPDGRPQPLAGTAAAVRRRRRRGVGGQGRGAGRRRARLLGPLAPGRRGDPLGARGAAGPDAPGDRLGARATARRCTRTCPSSGPRTRPAWPPTGAPRPRCSTTPGALGPRATAVHATHLVGRDVDLLGGSRTLRLPLPDHRGRPGRRDRPGPRAGHRGLPADPGQRQPGRDRPAGGGAPGRARGAAGQPGSAGTSRPASWPGRPPRTGTPAWAGPTPARSPPGALADLVTVALDSPRLAGATADDCAGVGHLRRVRRRCPPRRGRRRGPGAGRPAPAGRGRPGRAVRRDPPGSRLARSSPS